MQWFDVLGVPPNATADQIRRSARRLAAPHHPDKKGGDPEKFRAVMAARDLGLQLRTPSQNRPHEQPEQGATIYHAVTVTVAESIRGLVAEVQGVRVSVPPGVQDGQKIRLAQHGDPGIAGGPPGDLVIEIRIEPDPRWFRDDPHLLHVLPCTWIAAYRGDVVRVSTPWGRRYVTIPPGSATGTRIIVPGAGVAEGGELRILLELVAPLPGQMDLEAALADARYPDV